MSNNLAPSSDSALELERPVTPSRRRVNSPMFRIQSISEDIRFACLRGNLTSLEQIIKGDNKLANEIFEDGWSPLMVAANAGNPTIVKFLLSVGADPNLCRFDGFSPLIASLTSSAKGSVLVQQCVQYLIDAGANVNARSNDGLSPLLLAVKDNRVSVVDTLIFQGADINVTDNSGRSVSDIAMERKLERILQTLDQQKINQSKGKNISLTNSNPNEVISPHDINSSNNEKLSMKEPEEIKSQPIFGTLLETTTNNKVTIPMDESNSASEPLKNKVIPTVVVEKFIGESQLQTSSNGDVMSTEHNKDSRYPTPSIDANVSPTGEDIQKYSMLSLENKGSANNIPSLVDKIKPSAPTNSESIDKIKCKKGESSIIIKIGIAVGMMAAVIGAYFARTYLYAKN